MDIFRALLSVADLTEMVPPNGEGANGQVMRSRCFIDGICN